MAKQYIDFDSARLKRDMEELVKNTAINTMSAIFTLYRTNLAGNDIHPLDRNYLTAMIEDITPTTLVQVGNLIKASSGVGDKSQVNQSFRAVYYEYGTGELARPPIGYDPSSDPFRNPARGSSKAFHYWRDGHIDMGGNFRRGVNRDSEIPDSSPYAQPIPAGHNLKRAVMSMRPEMVKDLQRGVSRLNPISYTTVRGINVRA